ncbi:MAG: hypothetical protein AAF623_19850 [Planctomycetota bacterium]
MARRPDISILLFDREGIFRADFSRNSKSPSFQIRESADVESNYAEALDEVIRDKPSLAAQIVVASTNIWSQIVLLPKLSVTGIEENELEEALKFEAETLSGIEIDDIAVAYSLLRQDSEFNYYWVSAIRQSDLDQANELLESVGCRSITLAHPAGLGMAPGIENQFPILEIWDEQTFRFERQPGFLNRVRQFTPEELKPAHSILLHGQDEWDATQFEEVFDLSEDAVLTQWAQKVAGNFLEDRERVGSPLIQLSKETNHTPLRYLATALIAILVLGLCFWHWKYMTQVNRSLRAEIEEIKNPAELKKRYDSQLMIILEQRTEVEVLDAALGDDLKRVQFFLDNQSNRIVKLLELLANQRTPNLVIDKISGVEQGVMISGISLNVEAAQALAKRLRELATPLGWVVNPAKQEGQEKLTTGGPWNYEIILTDTGPFETAVQPRKKIPANTKP